MTLREIGDITQDGQISSAELGDLDDQEKGWHSRFVVGNPSLIAIETSHTTTDCNSQG